MSFLETKSTRTDETFILLILCCIFDSTDYSKDVSSMICRHTSLPQEGKERDSTFGGFRVKPSPTNVTLVTTRFHALLFFLPVFNTLNISASVIGRTFGTGTLHLPAFSLRFCFTLFDNTYAPSTE
jgi:hypothetical protein